MRKTFVLLLLAVSCVYARSEHYVGLTLGFQSPLLSERLALTSPRVGYGGMAGCEWLWQKGVFTMEAGLQAAYSTARIAVSDETLGFDMRDTQGKSFVYQGYVSDRMEDYSMLDLQVPLLLGIEYKHVYASAGAVAVYTVTCRSRQTAQLTATGEYDRYYETLTDMPNHGYFNRQRLDGASSLGSGLDVRLHAEAGAVWHTSGATRPTRRARSSSGEVKWRLGLFFGYGFRDLLAGTAVFRRGGATVAMSEPDVSEFMTVALHPVYSSRQAEGTRINAMEFGIRLSVFFPLSSSGSHGSRGFSRSCNCMP